MTGLNIYSEKDIIKKLSFADGSKIWFTSDTHFSHDNIIKFCQRPFENVEQMNEYLIEQWNSCVKKDDIVFHLGDFAWGGSSVWVNILQRLNGRKVLIVGNHDVKNLRSNYHNFFETITYQLQIIVEGQPIYLNHYPFLAYGGSYRKEPVWQLFGHVHTCKNTHQHEGQDDKRLPMLFPFQYDVGVDNNDYKPVNFHQVKEIITNKIKNYESQ